MKQKEHLPAVSLRRQTKSFAARACAGMNVLRKIAAGTAQMTRP
jgi:hypothetical protein